MNTKHDGFVESQDVKIHFLANNLDDTNKISVLFVPGIMLPAWIWEKQFDYFSKSYRVVCMDPRSQGDSEQSSEGHYALSRAKDIKAVVDKLKLEPLILVGWSLAVAEVVNYAAHFATGGLMGLVLVDGLVGIDPSLSFYQPMVNYWGQFQTDRVRQTREFLKIIIRKPQTDEYFEKLTAAALRTPTNTVMTLITNYMLQDFHSLLPHLKIPTLITTIEGSRLDYTKEMQRLIPHSRLEIFKAGHALFVDQPEKFNLLLESFILETANI